MQPLYQLLKDYNRKEIDDAFLEKAFQYMIEEDQSLLPYITNFDIEDEKKEKRLGVYFRDQRKILVHRINIGDCPYNRDKKLLGLAVLRHEIEHARNLKTFLEGEDDFEKQILSSSFKDYAYIHGLIPREGLTDVELSIMFNIMRMNQDFDPDERIAEIKAWKYLVRLLNNPMRNPEEVEARYELLKAYRSGYEKRYSLEPPTYKFLINTKQFEELFHIIKRLERRKFGFDTRLLYGLPLTDEEYFEKTFVKTRIQIERGEDDEDGI